MSVDHRVLIACNSSFRGDRQDLLSWSPPWAKGGRHMCLAIPGQVVEVVDESRRLAIVEVAGVRRTVSIGLLDGEDGAGAGPGDWVLIHVGFALAKVDAEEAAAQLALLEAMGAEYEQELEELKESAIG
jgi:hydrogenase expression/formation protein HypC